jgi:hypothetical protein
VCKPSNQSHAALRQVRRAEKNCAVSSAKRITIGSSTLSAIILFLYGTGLRVTGSLANMLAMPSSCIPHELEDPSGIAFLAIVVNQHISVPRPKSDRGRRADATTGTRNDHDHSLKIF